MGLDLMEMVLDIEDTFGILIMDDAAAQWRTVGQLHQYILECRLREKEPGCRTGRVFREIRRVLMETASVPRRSIRPSTSLKAILPPRTRRRVWRRLEATVWWRLRGLRLPLRLGPLMAGACVLSGALGTAMIVPHVGFGPAVVLGGTAVLAMLLLLLLTFFITRPFATAFPRGVVTVGDLTHAALPSGYEAAIKQQISDEEVWEKLRETVAETLGVTLKDVTPSARFVEDLGAG